MQLFSSSGRRLVVYHTYTHTCAFTQRTYVLHSTGAKGKKRTLLLFYVCVCVYVWKRQDDCSSDFRWSRERGQKLTETPNAQWTGNRGKWAIIFPAPFCKDSYLTESFFLLWRVLLFRKLYILPLLSDKPIWCQKNPCQASPSTVTEGKIFSARGSRQPGSHTHTKVWICGEAVLLWKNVRERRAWNTFWASV